MMTTLVQSLASDFREIGSPNEDLAWSLNAGMQELNHKAGWVIENQSVWTSLNDGEVSQFNSAGDLDFTGEFVYALNAGGPTMLADEKPLVIGDAEFADATIAREVCLLPGSCLTFNRDVFTAERSSPRWYPDADYGDTSDDQNLEFVMQSIRWESNPGFSIDLAVEPGRAYKLQMLFAELWRERGWDIFIEGEEVVSDFIPYQEQGGINKKDTGVVYTHEFVSSDTELNIRFTGDAGVIDKAPVINALTLEKLNEPTAPAWFQLTDNRNEAEFDGFKRGDVLVQPTRNGDGSGAANAGAANVTWTSPEDTMVSVSGGLWTMDDGVGDFQWRLDLNGRELTSGTMLANEFDSVNQFNVESGDGGWEAVHNLLMEQGDELRLTITGSDSEYVGVDLSVSSDSQRIPRFELGKIPGQDATSGEPVSFFVDVPDGTAGSLTMNVRGLSNLETQLRISLEPNGLFTYTPHADDHFDVIVEFQATVQENPKSQQVTIRTNEISSERELVTRPGELPNANDYVVVGEEVLNENFFFNTRNRETRRVEISGKHVDLIPGDENNLFADYTYVEGGVANADIQELFIYAETVVIGGELRLPGTDVTIYAKELIFQDSDEHIAKINTTPLAYGKAAAQFQNGQRGEDAGNVTLHVHSVQLPDDGVENPVKRFVLRGGDGQAAGEGRRGANGQSRTIPQPQDVPNPINAVGILKVLGEYPTATYIQLDNAFRVPVEQVGSRSFPTDGGNAVPGGRPGDGGTGGRLKSSLLQVGMLTDVSGGAAGSPATSLKGGRAGTPRTAYQVRVPFIGSWDVKSRVSSNGTGWNAITSRGGSTGRAEMLSEQNRSDWLHPAGMQAMISYAKDAYLNGHNDLAAELFNNYGNLLNEAISAMPEFASQLSDMRTEVATFEHQLANRLDYFGNPPGWAPTLSFAANYRAFQNAIDSDLKTLFLSRLIQEANESQEASLVSFENLLGELDEAIDHATSDLNDAQARLPGFQIDLQNIVVATEEIKDELSVREARLKAQAESNVSTRHILDAIGGLLSVVPIPTVSAVGTGLSAVNGFVADPSVGALANAAKGIADPFKQATLDASSGRN